MTFRLIEARRALAVAATAAAALLSGCAATGPQFSGVAKPVEDKGDVYLYRTSALFAVAQSFSVTLDGKDVGQLYNASYLQMRVSPGKHELKVAPGGFSKTSELTIEVEGGKQRFYQYEFATGPIANVFFAGASIQERSQDTALQHLRELKAAK